jgi:hypothetical protein
MSAPPSGNGTPKVDPTSAAPQASAPAAAVVRPAAQPANATQYRRAHEVDVYAYLEKVSQ